jgi:putative hydrolase of the HAD superfamily
VPDWDAVETVCLDMDGTVLDLRFDNFFWLEELPRAWGEARGLGFDEAFALLKPRFDAKRGTLEWYCIDHWSEELGFDIAELKHRLSGRIRYLPGAPGFLRGVRELGRRLLLTTNAHPISLDIKNRRAGLEAHFDELISSHGFGAPKESPVFWERLRDWHHVDLGRALFVDDSAAVLRAARAAGVGTLYQLVAPDSTLPDHPAAEGFAGIRSLAEITP